MTSPADPAEPGPRKRKRSGRRTLVEIVVTILVAVLLAGLVRTFAFQTFFVPSSSMVPTLQVNDRILVQKAFFNWHDVREGDIVVFTHPPRDTCGAGDLVKRVIALPGQTIYSSGNNIYIDGKLLPEPFLPRYDPLGPAIPDASEQHPYRVPAGDFYLMGDNRAISCDSRYWGPIKGSSIIGKVVLVWWRNGHPYFRGFLGWAVRHCPQKSAASAAPPRNDQAAAAASSAPSAISRHLDHNRDPPPSSRWIPARPSPPSRFLTSAARRSARARTRSTSSPSPPGERHLGFSQQAGIQSQARAEGHRHN